MVLDALFQIKNDIDPTFAFRRHCLFLKFTLDPAVREFADRAP